MTEPRPQQPDPRAAGYERNAISIQGVFWFVVIFIAFGAASLVGIWVVYSHLHFTVTERNAATTALPPDRNSLAQPPLQPSPKHDVLPHEDLALLRQRERAEFARRGWIDEKTTDIRIPDNIVEAVTRLSATQPSTRPTS